jgi:hypothetical protein
MLTVRTIVVEAICLVEISEILEEVITYNIVAVCATSVGIDRTVVGGTVHKMVEYIVLDHCIDTIFELNTAVRSILELVVLDQSTNVIDYFNAFRPILGITEVVEIVIAENVVSRDDVISVCIGDNTYTYTGECVNLAVFKSKVIGSLCENTVDRAEASDTATVKREVIA